MARSIPKSDPFAYSRFAREPFGPVNRGRPTGSTRQLTAGSSRGTGSKGSLSQLTRGASKGTGSKGSLSKLVSGTRRNGKMPRPAMGRGPINNTNF